MPVASNDERTATVGITQPQEHLVRPFQDSEPAYDAARGFAIARRAGSHALRLASPR